MESHKTPLMAVIEFPGVGAFLEQAVRAFSNSIDEAFQYHVVEPSVQWSTLPYRASLVPLTRSAVTSGDAANLIDKLRTGSPTMRLLLLESEELEWIAHPGNVLDQINIRDKQSSGLLKKFATTLLDHARSYKLPPIESAISSNAMVPGPDGKPAFNPILFTPIEDFHFTPRSRKVLLSRGVFRLGDLIRLSEPKLLQFSNLGRKSLMEIKDAVAACGLRLDSDIPNWPPEDMDREQKLGELAVRIGAQKQIPSGTRFEPKGDRLSIDPSGDASDDRTAAKPFVAQLHADIIRKARAFADVAPRLANQPGWLGIVAAAERFLEAIDRPTSDTPGVLGSLYGALTELGSFMELGSQVDLDGTSFAPPLDPAVRRPLDDLVKTAAPWLRSFPSIVEMDDELAQFMSPAPLLKPSAHIVTTANEVHLLIQGDAEALAGIIEAGSRGQTQGAKAGSRGVSSVRNLIAASVTILASAYAGAVAAEAGPHSQIVEKSAQFILKAESEIIKLMENVPADFRAALRSLARDAHSGK